MLKKILMTSFVLLCSISFFYGISNMKMKASTNTVNTEITGRMGGLAVGDKFTLSIGDFQIVDSNIALAKDPMGHGNYHHSDVTGSQGNLYSKSNLRDIINEKNALLTASDLAFIERNIKLSISPTLAWQKDWCNEITEDEVAYLYPYTSGSANGSTNLALKRPSFGFGAPYWFGFAIKDNLYYSNIYIDENGNAQLSVITDSFDFRPAVKANNAKILFSLDKNIALAEGNRYTNIKNPQYTSGSLITTATGNTMKSRVADSNITLTLSDIKDSLTDQSISKIEVDSDLKLEYTNATTGSNQMISLIVEKDGKWISYENLKTVGNNASGSIEVSTTGWAVGTYTLSLINEQISSSNEPILCSAFAKKTLQVTEAVPHKITYQKSPASGASAGVDYEFGKNVNALQTIGTVTVNPTGTLPLTYQIESNNDQTYRNFEIDGLDEHNASSATSLNVRIKNNAPDLVNGGLKSGNYKFCINSIDARGKPESPTSDSKVCTEFSVAQITPTVVFTEPNDTKKSISEASVGWSETATATPSDGVKVTYEKVSGDIGLIDIDPDTGAITYKGSGAYGKVTIRATADDDPSSGHDNYNPASVTKEIVIYAEVNGSVTPHANSSDINTPTLRVMETEVSLR